MKIRYSFIYGFYYHKKINCKIIKRNTSYYRVSTFLTHIFVKITRDLPKVIKITNVFDFKI